MGELCACVCIPVVSGGLDVRVHVTARVYQKSGNVLSILSTNFVQSSQRLHH